MLSTMLSPESLDTLMAMTLWLSAVSTVGSLHVGPSDGVKTHCAQIMLDLTGYFEATTPKAAVHRELMTE